MIAGSTHWDWTAYLFTDTYFDGEDGENVLAYHETGHGMTEDPLTCGNHNADQPLWDPRQYFLDVLYYRLLEVLREWEKVVHKVEQRFRRYEQVPLPLSLPCEH